MITYTMELQVVQFKHWTLNLLDTRISPIDNNNISLTPIDSYPQWTLRYTTQSAKKSLWVTDDALPYTNSNPHTNTNPKFVKALLSNLAQGHRQMAVEG